MKILVYGAGVVGSLLAARLCEAGEEVTVLARGNRLAEIRDQGLVLEDSQTGLRTITRVNVAETLAPDDAYDWVLVILRKSQLGSALRSLAANQQTPNLLFLMNNAAGPGEIIKALGRPRVVLGFPGAGGVHEGAVIRYVAGTRRRKATVTLGELDGGISPRLLRIASAIENAGFRTAFTPDIDAWLKTHAAVVLPLAAAVYMAAGDNYRLAHTRDALVLGVRGMKEGIQALRAFGFPITPLAVDLMARLPEPLLVRWLERTLDTPEAEIGIAGHARAARDEMGCLAGELMALARASGTPTPALDRLLAWIDPARQPIPEGSAEAPLDWRSTWLGLGAASALVVGLALWRRGTTHGGS